MKIPFNKPFLTGREVEYIRQSVESGQISGDGIFTKKCHEFFERKYGFKKVLLTTSCTDAMEMAAMLFNIGPGDEVIIPSFTFVSTANAFAVRGASIVFADSESETPNICVKNLDELITKKTKAIVAVHYAGFACDMDSLMKTAKKHNLLVLEDAAHSIDSYYKNLPLGSIGNLSAFSFHETKNIISGEGGMIVINDAEFIKRAEIIREKGTNRSAFFRGEIDKYNWVDIGSSYLPSDIMAAFLFAQLENMDAIQKKRKSLWNSYYGLLEPLAKNGFIKLPFIPDYATNNAHLFYIITRNITERTELIAHLREKDILAVFHYQPLHLSPYYLSRNARTRLANAEMYSDCLLRLPMYYDLSTDDVNFICTEVRNYYKKAAA